MPPRIVLWGTPMTSLRRSPDAVLTSSRHASSETTGELAPLNAGVREKKMPSTGRGMKVQKSHVSGSELRYKWTKHSIISASAGSVALSAVCEPLEMFIKSIAFARRRSLIRYIEQCSTKVWAMPKICGLQKKKKKTGEPFRCFTGIKHFRRPRPSGFFLKYSRLQNIRSGLENFGEDCTP